MIPEYQRQLEQLSKNAMEQARIEQARIARELRAIDRANEKRGCNGSGAARPDKIHLAPLTLHDKAVNNPLLRKLLRDMQRGIQ
jgi:hypothetical protein